MVYPSIRRGGPGGAGAMVIDQSRAMFATLPSKRTRDVFETAVMRRHRRWKPRCAGDLGAQTSW